MSKKFKPTEEQKQKYAAARKNRMNELAFSYNQNETRIDVLNDFMFLLSDTSDWFKECQTGIKLKLDSLSLYEKPENRDKVKNKIKDIIKTRDANKNHTLQMGEYFQVELENNLSHQSFAKNHEYNDSHKPMRYSKEESEELKNQLDELVPYLIETLKMSIDQSTFQNKEVKPKKI